MYKLAGNIMTRPNSSEGQLTPQTAAEIANIANQAAKAAKEGKQPGFNTTTAIQQAIRKSGQHIQGPGNAR
jgi:hypothetical protein